MEHDMNLLPGDDYLMNCWYGAWHEPVTRWWADAPVMLVDAVVIGYLMNCSPHGAWHEPVARWWLPDELLIWSMTWTCCQVMSRCPSDAGRCCCNRIPDELFTTWSMTWTCCQVMITWWTVDMEHDMNLLPGDEQMPQWCWSMLL